MRCLPFLVVPVLLFPASARAAEGEIIVQRAPGADRAELREAAGVEHVRALPLSRTDLVRPAPGETPQEALTALRADDDVVYAELDQPVSISRDFDDTGFEDLWGLHNTGQNAGLAGADIDALDAWKLSEGLGVTVAVVDTGINAAHEDLATQLADNPAERDGLPGVDDDANGYVDDIQGWDFVGRDAVAEDRNGHGTHVAGTIAAAGANGAGIVGVAPSAKVLPVRALGATGQGTTSGIAAAFDYAGALGIKVVNASLGGPFSRAVRDAIAAHPDTLYVVAAGNAGADADRDANAFPCALPEENVVCVGASDNHDERAWFSNYGATAVDLFAPGVHILSTYVGATDVYATSNGTSMAAPHVSGAAALVLAVNPAATSAVLRRALLDSADPRPALSGLAVTGGRLNAGRAVAAALEPQPEAPPAPEPPVATATPEPPPAATPAPITAPAPAAAPTPRLSHLVVRRKGNRLKVAFQLSHPTTVKLTLKGRRTLVRWSRAGRAGANAVTLSSRMRPGRYVLTAGGATRSFHVRR
jgi:subtilisin family serine protease